MTTKSKLTELVSEATTRVDAFYQQAIAWHTDARLRSLASQINEARIYIVRERDSGTELFYDHDGFNARVAVRCLEAGNWAENGIYEYAERIFRVQEGKLVVNAGQYGRPEMLSLFPRLTVETIEEKLAKGIGNSRWLRGEGK